MRRRSDTSNDFENFDEDEDLGSLSSVDGLPAGSSGHAWSAPSVGDQREFGQTLFDKAFSSKGPSEQAVVYQRTSEMRRAGADAAGRGRRRGSRFSSSPAQAPEPSWADEDASGPRPQLSGAKLLHKALQMQVRREHTQLELRRKLARWSSDEAAISQVLEELQRRGWQSDERYTEGFVARKAASHGVAAIRQDLKQVGLPKDVIAEHLEPLQDSEYERARAVWSRRFGRELPERPSGLSRQDVYLLQQKERARQMRFLAARGFSVSVIQRVVRGVHDDDDMSQASDSEV